jgi:tRNA(fMet)-specific endonuclease VapC
VSMINVFELFVGVFRCNDPQGEERKVSTFLGSLHLLPFDFDSALKTAQIRFQLEKAGTKISPYDLQISGQALALDLTLVTHNNHEFKHVTGLRLEDWEIQEPPLSKRICNPSLSPRPAAKRLRKRPCPKRRSHYDAQMNTLN